jgi:hypothetical protein
MSGDRESLLRAGFIPMICYGMTQFIKHHYHDDFSQDKADICCALVEGIQSYVRALPSRSVFHIATAKEVIKKRLLRCLGTAGGEIAELISWESSAVQKASELVATFEATCHAVPTIESRLLRIPGFIKCMNEASDRFAIWVNNHTAAELLALRRNRIFLLQQTLYSAIPEEKRDVWLGLVHHYMVHTLQSAPCGAYAEDVKLFLWTEFDPLTDTSDFFTSAEYKKGFSQYLSEGIVHTTCVPLMSLETLKGKIEDGEFMLDVAKEQLGMIKVHSVAFIRHLLKAFSDFQERIRFIRSALAK